MENHVHLQHQMRPWRVQNRYPFTLQFGITSKCNLQCAHCYDDTEEHIHMPYDHCITILDKFFSFCQQWRRFPTVWVTGGEPTLHPQFWDVLDYIGAQSEQVHTEIYVAILSNGTTFTTEVIKKLKEYPLRIHVQISVDGASAETHDAIRGKGSYKKAVHALNLLTRAQIGCHMHFVVHKDNYEDGFCMTDLAKELKVDVLTVTRLVPWGRGKTLHKKMLNPEQVYTLFKKLSDDFDALCKNSNPPKPLISRNRCDWPVIYSDPSTPESLTKNGHSCTAAQSYINVMENGDVYPCRRMPITVGNLLKEDLMTIWQHPLMWKLRQKHKFVQGKCTSCYFCVTAPRICKGGASCISYAVYGDPFQPDPQCCIEPLKSPAGI